MRHVGAGDLKSRLLQGLSPADRESILAAATQRRFAANSVVIQQGDPADRLFLLVRGCARHFFITLEGRKVLLRWLPPGDIFGGFSFLPHPSSYLVSTEVIKDSTVLIWTGATLRDLAARCPTLLENALWIASDYLSWFLAAHLSLVSHTARQRVASVLLSLGRGIGHEADGGIRFDLTNEQLANAANVTPFTASRFLSEWQRDGTLAKKRGSIVLRLPRQLATV